MDVRALYDADQHHPDDRIALYGAVAAHFAAERVLYPGCYLDIALSVWFADVTYCDLDKRANRFFGEKADVVALIEAERRRVAAPAGRCHVSFHHGDYREPLPLEGASFDLLVSMYAGFVHETTHHHLRPGGHLLVNTSHGDAWSALHEPTLRLVAAVVRRSNDYAVVRELDGHLTPKRRPVPTRDELHQLGRGVAARKSAAAYLFRKLGNPTPRSDV